MRESSRKSDIDFSVNWVSVCVNCRIGGELAQGRLLLMDADRERELKKPPIVVQTDRKSPHREPVTKAADDVRKVRWPNKKRNS